MSQSYIDRTHKDPQHRLGKRVIDGDSIKGTPEDDRFRPLLEQESELRTAADRYVSQRVDSLKSELSQRRHTETQQELNDLEVYAAAERE